MRRAFFFFFGAALAVWPPCAISQVVINEIMYHDPTNSRAEEYVELYNRGSDEVDVGGWQFTEGITFVFPEGTVIEGGRYLIVCADYAAFVWRHPQVSNVVGGFTGRLDNDGEELTLCDSELGVVNSVEYTDSYPWPEAADGSGPSLELTNPFLDNADAQSWGASSITGGTPGGVNSVFTSLPPVANAGEAKYAPEAGTVFLDGTGSEDVDGEIVSFAWIQTAGPGVDLVGGDTPTPHFSAPEVSEHTSLLFELTVRDNDGLTSLADVEVIVINVAGEAASGILPADATWDAAGSPYIITGDLTVPGGTTLTIEPGAVVELLPSASIIVEGVLAAEGTEEHEILFERVSGIHAPWGRLRFDRSVGSVLRCCAFAHGSKAGSFSSSIPDRSALYITDSEMTIDRCRFWFFDDYVLTAENSAVTISRNSFYETGEAINLTACVATIEGNRIEGVGNGDDAIDINADWIHASPTPVAIQGNVILRVSGDGIDLGGCSPLIKRNLISLCADKGISLGEGSDARIENNILTRNGTGIAVKDGSNPLIVNNTIVKNGVGLSYYQKEAEYGGGKGTAVNCIVWGNERDLSYDRLSLPNISYSIVGGESVCPGEGNRNENPLFLDPEHNDLQLRADSPAVDSATSEGCPEEDFCGERRTVGEAPDMGALEWNEGSHDMDADGVPDDMDAFPLDPRYALDEDSDALPDEWEERFFRSTGARPDDDLDGDGFSNKEEYHRGTNPASGAHASVVINEIHYHPASDTSLEEFIELYNRSSSEADISLWGITDEVLFYFPEGTVIPPHGYVVIARDPGRIEGMHGIEGVYGPYARTLSNASGVVRLVDEEQASVCQVSYSDAPPWPAAADGDGPSLELRRPDLDPDDAASWTSSWVTSGTPGKRNSHIEEAVVINEFMALPAQGDDWIELYNTVGEETDLSGFYVSDDKDNLTRYRIPDGTVIGGGGFLLVTQSQCGFGLGSGGETIFLTAPDGVSIWSQYTYFEQIAGVSQGRNPDGGEDWRSYLFGSPGTSNPSPQLTGGVVINEVYYHPQSDKDGQEFVEVYNTTDQAIHLSGWAFLDGFGYHFPLGTILAPDSYLVVGHDPAQVEELFGIGSVLGPFESGRLSNRGERIALYDNLGNLVDSVIYADGGAWPTAPDGDGASLELINPNFDRNVPACWAASLDAPTPGTVNSVLSDNIPPQIVSLIHSPTIPTAGDTVLLQARVTDHDGHIASADVFFKRDQDQQYASLPMTPESPGSDIYRAVLPQQPDGTLVEFYIRAEDDRGTVTVRPHGAPEAVSTETGELVTISYLYIVDGSSYSDNLPLYRLLATEENLTEIEARPLESDVLLSTGLVYANQPFYDVAIRYREQMRVRRGIRIELRGTERLHGDRKINLSRMHALEEHLCAEFFRSAGIPVYDTMHVRVVINQEDKGYYLDIERVDDDFIGRNLPSDAGGTLCQGPGEELIVGDDTGCFLHLWNETLWSYDQPDYEERLDEEIDVGQWIRWFATLAVCANWDNLLGHISTNHLEYQRPSDGRIVLFPFDIDDGWVTFAECVNIHGGSRRWGIDPRVDHFLRHPPFRRQYYEEIVHLIDNQFAPASIYPVIEEVCARLGESDAEAKRFVKNRTAYLRQAIENLVAQCHDFAPVIDTNEGHNFFTSSNEAVVSGAVVRGSGAVEVFRVASENRSLLANSGFEEGTGSWRVADVPEGVSVGTDDSELFGGHSSLRIDVSGTRAYDVLLEQIVDCSPQTKYRLSLCAKARNMASARTFFRVVDPDNGESYLNVRVPQDEDTVPAFYGIDDCNWTLQSGIVLSGETTRRLAIQLVLSTEFNPADAPVGFVWYDNVEMKEVGGGYEPAGTVSLDRSTGTWTVALPLRPGANAFEFVAIPVGSRDYQSPPTRLCIYRSEDADGDGLPDCWEMDWFGSLSPGPIEDPDGDAATNETEFLSGSDPCCADTDGDSIPDGLELAYGLDAFRDDAAFDLDADGLTNEEECLQYGSNPADPDTDGDGLLDNEEVLVHGTNPALSDTDGDGQSDSDELYAGTDPLNPASVFAVAEMGREGTDIRLRWSTVPGRRYLVDTSDDMVEWIRLTNWITAEGDSLAITVSPSSFARRFYRVRVIP